MPHALQPAAGTINLQSVGCRSLSSCGLSAFLYWRIHQGSRNKPAQCMHLGLHQLPWCQMLGPGSTGWHIALPRPLTAVNIVSALRVSSEFRPQLNKPSEVYHRASSCCTDYANMSPLLTDVYRRYWIRCVRVGAHGAWSKRRQVTVVLCEAYKHLFRALIVKPLTCSELYYFCIRCR